MKFTILVNKDNKVTTKYLKKIKLVSVRKKAQEFLVEENTYKAFLELQAFWREKKVFLELKKAFVPFEVESFDEHSTGLALDISLFNENDDFSYEEVFDSLDKFGFIFNYNDEDACNKDIHIRYVGKVVAPIIRKNKWTLEEYLTNFSAIIAINKEKGMTSFDVVAEVSNLFGFKKSGHTGTLDPLAEGVMLVAINKATKVVELLTSYEKEYVAKVKIGVETDTLDITGNVIKKSSIPNNLDINKGLTFFKKTYNQEVPIYSAVKVKGKKLYEYARNKKDVSLPKRQVTVKEIELLEKEQDTFTFKALVSKGCYIRSLIRDICNYLGVCGTMSELTRTKQGNISIDECSKLSDIKNNNYKLYSMDELLAIKTIMVDDSLAFKIKNGQVLENTWGITDKVLFKDKEDKLLGIYEGRDNKLKVWKNF